MNTLPHTQPIPLVAFGLSLSLFLALSFVLCFALALVTPDIGLHTPWFQFFPGFSGVNLPSFLVGIAESLAYGWYIALVFGWLYNTITARRR